MLTTFDLLPQPMQGNVRTTSKGAILPIEGNSGAPPPDGSRMLQKGILFAPQMPGFSLEEWTVWRKESPLHTLGCIAKNEFRALVCASDSTCVLIVELACAYTSIIDAH